MRGKSKLLFLICAFALTFMFAINVKAASAPCCENGTRTLTDAYACNQCTSCTAGACPSVTSCTAGKYLSGGSCLTCPAGSYCTGGTAQPVKCSAGTYSGSGARECSQCNGSNQYSFAGATSCSTCSSGYSPNSGHTACVRTSCPAGQYLNSTSSTGCSSCPAGSYCTGGTAQPTKCSAGTYSASGARECSQCNGSNQYSGAGATSCSTCSSGYSPNSGHTACVRTSCPAGQYLNSTSSTGCSSCPAGSYCPGGSAQPTKCSAGTYSSSGATSCTTCANGYYSGAGATSCTKCPTGQTSNSTHTACTSSVTAPCCVTNASGTKTTINDTNGCQQAASSGATVSSGACQGATSCPAGQGADSSATTGCSNCAAGYYSPAGSTVCSKCSAGTYSSAGASSCTTCADGYYSAAGASSCTKCPTGQTSNSTHTSCSSTVTSPCCVTNKSGTKTTINDLNGCQQAVASGATVTNGACPTTPTTGCGAGQGKDTSATTGCSNCARGYYSPANDDSCHACPSGYTSAAGTAYQTDCYKTVPAGQSATWTGTGHTITACAKGFYSLERTVKYGASSTCTACPSGQTTAGTGSTSASACTGGSTPSIIMCPAGKGATGTPTSITDCSYCARGYYSPADDNTCHACPSGYTSAAGSTYQTDCYKTIDAGKSATWTGTGHTITACAKGFYSESRTVKVGASSTCTACPSGQTTDSTGSTSISACKSPTTPITAPCCVTNVSGTKTTINDTNGCQQAQASGAPVVAGECPAAVTCPEGKYENESGQCVECNYPGQYKAGKLCFTCPDGYKADATHPYCYIKVAAGSYLVMPGGPATNACAPGTYSTGKDVKLGEAYTCTSCGSGKTGPLGAKSADECYEKADQSQCTVTATTSEVRVSYGDHYNVHVSVSGKGCNGQQITLTPVNGTLPSSNRGTYDVNDGSGFNFTMTATEQNKCPSTSSLTVKLTNGKSATASVTTVYNWHLSASGVCVKTSELSGAPYNGINSRDAAEKKPQDLYYIVKDNAGCGSDYRRIDVWVRNCGGYAPPTGSNPACYLDKTSGDYVWGDYANDTTRFQKITSITTEAACKKPAEEQPYCYKKISDGTYHWGKYHGNEEYTLVDTSITEANCKTPETPEDPACYINGNTGEYVWGKYDGITLYTIISSITSEDKCVNPVDKCYKHKTTGEYVWGTYDENVYEVISGITSKDKCKVACFKCENDEYKWGGYDQYGSCTLVPNISTADSCKPVPITGASISKIIYALSLFLIMAGSGIVVYQLTKTKKQTN